MKLIAENSYEDQVLPGLVALLRDLQVDACGFRTKEAIAPVFWSCQDVCLEVPAVKELSDEEVTALLYNLESDLIEAMILAGFHVIENYLKDAKGIVVDPRHRSLL